MENNQSIEKKVEIGLADSQYTEVLSGLNEGEKVITAQRTDDEKISAEMRRRRADSN
ncbi:membrane-fusion protein [Actinobacillus pleuropneumoniae]|nr:membrane-fusion protein [Actinobacillus pleuropneumoniae]